MRFLVKAAVVSASSTPRPLIRSSTSRAFCGDTRWNLASALYSFVSTAIGLSSISSLTALSELTTVHCSLHFLYRGLAPASADLLLPPVCPLKVRVGENSPSLWPTMFSVTYRSEEH